ncbi:MAG: signal peptidase I [bacterium]
MFKNNGRTRRLFDYRAVPREKRTLILASMLFGSVLSYFLLVRYVIMIGEVEGTSMLPALHDGERHLINRMVYRFRDPQPDEIVEINMPGSGDFSVKRIIASPGDVVQIKDGHVIVNGKVRVEPYLPKGMTTEGKSLGTNAFRVSDNAYFVLGDNRPISADSRTFGAVGRDQLVGRLWIW